MFELYMAMSVNKYWYIMLVCMLKSKLITEAVLHEYLSYMT